MKTISRFLLFWISVSFLGLLMGCKDVAEVKETAAPAFPFERTITDSKGRSLTATILAKSGNKVALRRTSDRKEFILTLDNLSELDQSFLKTLPDAYREKIVAIEKKLAKEARLAGRNATWHNDIENAKREAAKLDLPICLFFVRSGGETNELFDRNVVNSTEFKQWASQNAVLCIYSKSPTSTNFKSTGLDGITAREGRDVASHYGVSKTPAVAILNSDGIKQTILSGYDRGSTQSYIKLLEAKL